MNITGIFISRPVMTTLVMLGIVLFGVAGYRALPVSDLPNVAFPTLQVYANLPGASPETMAANVATPAGAPVRHHPRPRFHDRQQFARLHQCDPAILAGALAGGRRTGRA